MLASLAGEIEGSVLALTDGPLELFRDPQGSKDTQQEFEEYLGVLHQLAAIGDDHRRVCGPAGFRPGGAHAGNPASDSRRSECRAYQRTAGSR